MPSGSAKTRHGTSPPCTPDTGRAPRGRPLVALVGEALGEAVALQATGEWSRVKACALESCRWVFFDESRNRSGRWCSMQVCGNRAKTAAYRARHR
ncbi:MAG: CGNR zinc finger domain-containing protein [Frankiaceae bacterium]|nr:CGNR zinc finger domain-containing protein [Frankiaceae bacterium]